jgi:hypothetical protein
VGEFQETPLADFLKSSKTNAAGHLGVIHKTHDTLGKGKRSISLKMSVLSLALAKILTKQFVDSAGRLIGINTQIISPSGAFAGVGFAVPVGTVNRVVPQLIKYGKLIRPGLGLSLIPDNIAAR